MSRIVRMANAIVTLVETDFKCPKCGCAHHEDDYYSDLFESITGAIYQKCKECKVILGITEDIKGDVVVWLKKDENKLNKLTK